MAWIRSQTGTYLLNITGVYESNDRLFALPEPQDYEIGRFSTQAAALEELNKIHDWIALQNAVGVYQVSPAPKEAT